MTKICLKCIWETEIRDAIFCIFCGTKLEEKTLSEMEDIEYMESKSRQKHNSVYKKGFRRSKYRR